MLYQTVAVSQVLQAGQPITTFSRKFECRISCLKGNHATFEAKLLFHWVSKQLVAVKWALIFMEQAEQFWQAKESKATALPQ